jgi:hypothetical protein
MGSKFSVARMRKELANQTMTNVTVSSDSTFQSGLILSDVGTVAASGSTAQDPQAISTHVAMVTAADGTKGVQLPSATIGEIYLVANTVANQTLKLYPSTGSYFNGLGQNVAVSLTGSQGAVCVYASSSAGNKWAVVWGGAS